MALTGRRPAEIFFSASVTSFEPYPIPILAGPKKIIRALEGAPRPQNLPSPDAANTTAGPQLPKYIFHAFGSLDQPWKPG